MPTLSHLAHVGYRAPPSDVLVGDVPDDPVQADPGVHLHLHRQDELEELVLRVGDVAALAMPLVDHGPGYDAAGVNLLTPTQEQVRRQTGKDIEGWGEGGQRKGRQFFFSRRRNKTRECGGECAECVPYGGE